MKKKILSITTALAMMLSMSSMALATEIRSPGDSGVYTSGEIEVSGTTTVPEIKITVPSTGNIVANPYKLEYDLGDSKKSSDQIVSVPQFIKNESNVAIDVSASVTGEIYSNDKNDKSVVFASAALKGTETTKSVFMYLDIVESENGSTATFGTAYDAKAANQLLVGTKTVTKKNVIQLAKPESSSQPTYAAYKFCGAVATNPAKAWTTADKVSAKVVFTFAPVVKTVSAP